MFDSLLADGLGLSEKVAGYAIKCLAVAGGFLIGYFLGKLVAWALDRWILANKSPDQLKKAISLLCGLALAILVALIVFGEGGNGLFGSGGGDGQGKGQPTPANDGKAAPTPAVEPKEVPPKKDETPKLPPPKATPDDVRVAILAGDEVKDGRFYLIDGDSAPKSLKELQALAASRKSAKADTMLIFRFKTETLSNTHPEMQRLTAWLREANQRNYFE